MITFAGESRTPRNLPMWLLTIARANMFGICSGIETNLKHSTILGKIADLERFELSIKNNA